MSTDGGAAADAAAGGAPDPAADASRRTHLAAERTWLAWWRSALATGAAAVAIGRIAPDVVGGSDWPLIALGVGLAVLAAAMFVAGLVRQRQVEGAIGHGGYLPLDGRLVAVFSVAGAIFAVVTLLIVLAG
jgi:putative membrane protein